jgi:hypothetical protein
MERELIAEYRLRVEKELACLGTETLERAVAVARAPDSVRRFGHVKLASVGTARAEWQRLQDPVPAATQ